MEESTSAPTPVATEQTQPVATESPTPTPTPTPITTEQTPVEPPVETQPKVTEPPVKTEEKVTLTDYVDNNKAPEKVTEKPPKKPTKTVEQPKESDQLKQQLEVVTNIARINLVKAANVHPYLVENLPTDLGKLSDYLESEAFKKANTTLHKATVLETEPVTNIPAQTPPKIPTNETPRPKKFDEITPESKVKITNLLRGFI